MILIPTIHIELADIIDAQLFLLQLDLVGFRGNLGGVVADVVGEGGGEEDDLVGRSWEKVLDT